MNNKIGLLVYSVLLIGLIPDISSKVVNHVDKEYQLNATAGELLLELMVKIAAHPTQWNKIHQLLENISSTTLFNKLIQARKIQEEPRYVTRTPPNSISKKQKFGNYKTKMSWPLSNNSDNKYKIFSKMFAYHRVTGRPNFFDKNPKTYIAVSIIAPKNTNTNFQDDLSLEKELHLLKPWTHKDNLEHMASIRSRWIIRKNKENNLFVP